MREWAARAGLGGEPRAAYDRMVLVRCLGRQAFAGPVAAAVEQAVSQSVVHPVGAALPELELVGPDAIAAPMRRARDFAVGVFGVDGGEAALEGLAIGYDAALIGGDGAELAGARAAGEVGVGLSG